MNKRARDFVELAQDLIKCDCVNEANQAVFIAIESDRSHPEVWRTGAEMYMLKAINHSYRQEECYDYALRFLGKAYENVNVRVSADLHETTGKVLYHYPGFKKNEPHHSKKIAVNTANYHLEEAVRINDNKCISHYYLGELNRSNESKMVHHFSYVVEKLTNPQSDEERRALRNSRAGIINTYFRPI